MKNIEKLAEIGKERLYERIREITWDIRSESTYLQGIKEGRLNYEKQPVRKVLFYNILNYRNLRNILSDCGFDVSEFDDKVADSLKIGKETAIHINKQGILKLLGLNREVGVA